MPNRHPWFTGFTLPDGRRGGFCWGQRPRCIDPHLLKPRDLVISDTITTCHHRLREGQRECGHRLYIRRLPSMGTWLIVEVTPEHVKKLHDADSLSFMETMEIIGCVLPGVSEEDLPDIRRDREQRERQGAA